MQLDRLGGVPLWRQVLGDLRRRLSSGEFKERFPSDREIVEYYKISRHTAREAVTRLNAEGLLVRGPGRGGTTLRPVEFKQPLGAIYSLFRAVEALGVEQSSIVRNLDIRIDAHAAERLGLGEEAPVVFLERLRLAGGTPLAIDKSWIPADLGRPLLVVDMQRTALYRELSHRCGIDIDGGEEEIQPVLPDEVEAELLQVSLGTPVFAVERTARAGGRIVEVRRTIIRGDRYSFVVAWSPKSQEDYFDGGPSSYEMRWPSNHG